MSACKKKSILYVITLFILLFILISIWQLDIFNWKKLDLNKITSSGSRTVIYDSNDLPVLAMGTTGSGDYIALTEP